MKKLLTILTSALAGMAISTQAAIIVGPSGTGTITFDTAPTAADGWTTASLPGDHSTYETIAALDAAIAGISASYVRTNLPTDTSTTPATSALGFRYNTTGHYIQSRPTQIAATLLLATLQNNTGGAVNSITITYDMNSFNPATEAIVGFRVYWSLTGAANSWQLIPELSTGTPGTLTATVNVGTWNQGATLYLLWADDNAASGTDPSYTIDNFSVVVPSTFAITTPTNNQTFAFGLPIPVHIAAPANVVSVTLYLEGNEYATLTSTPFDFAISNLLSGTYSIYASGLTSDNQTIFSSTVVFTVQPNQPPTVSFVRPTDGATFAAGLPITVTVNATDSDGGVGSVAFYSNGTLFATVSNAPYTAIISNTVPGAISLQAVATDILGASSTNTISITVNPNSPPTITSDLVILQSANPSNTVTEITVPVGTAVTNLIWATDTDTYLAGIRVYDGNNLVFQSANVLAASGGITNYTYIMNDALAGVHTLTAVIVDAGGMTVTSRPVTITVTNNSNYAYIITNGAYWRYKDDGSDQGPNNWTSVSFDDSSWAIGQADLGYEIVGNGYANLHPPRTTVNGGPVGARFITTYFRHSFYLTNWAQSGYTNLVLHLLRDDGAVVYINGTPVWTNNITASPITYTTVAAGTGGSEDGTVYNVYGAPLPPSLLQEGLNVVAVEIHQASATSSDISFDLMLMAEPPSPVVPPARPNIGLAYTAGAPQMTLTITNANFTLQEAPAIPVTGSPAWGPASVLNWSTNGSIINATIPVSQTKRFYRITIP